MAMIFTQKKGERNASAVKACPDSEVPNVMRQIQQHEIAQGRKVAGKYVEWWAVRKGVPHRLYFVEYVAGAHDEKSGKNAGKNPNRKAA